MPQTMYTKEEFLEAVRGANKTRANWFYMIMKEVKEQGGDPDAICKKVIYDFGNMRGQKYAVADTPGKMANMLYNSNGQDVFNMELKENTDTKGVLLFHYCPLADAWNELGLNDEEKREICRLACYGDYGRVDCAQNVNLEFPQKIAHGDPVCELLFTKK